MAIIGGIYAPNTPTLIGDLGVRHPATEKALQDLGERVRAQSTIDAALVVSPHFVTAQGFGLVGTSEMRQLFDFQGFPPEFYQVRYMPPGAPRVAQQLLSLCTQALIPAAMTKEWGLDHGAWAPLVHLFPRVYPSRDLKSIFDAAMDYKAQGTPLVVLAGKEYGTGSSRDWAAKGPKLLGVAAIIAQSYERIHRSNLVGMGILPLQFLPGESYESWGVNGDEVLNIDLPDSVHPGSRIPVRVTDPETDSVTEHEVVCRLDSAVEIDYFHNNGILQTVFNHL